MKSQLHKAQRMSGMLYKLCTAAGMTGKELQRNCAPRSFMNIIFHIETRKSGKQFVLHIRVEKLGS